MLKKPWKNVGLAAGVAGALLIAACASAPATPPAQSSRTVSKPLEAVILKASDTAEVKVETASGVDMLDSEKARFADEISQKLAERQTKIPSGGNAHHYSLEVTITRYTKGSALERALSPDLGQIHMEGDVKLYELPLRSPLRTFKVSKTIAWGGIYGPTTATDVENTFVEGVANVLTGTR